MMASSDPDRWQRISDILADALELPPARRAAFVADRAGDDAALRSELEGLLAAAASERGRFDSPAVSAIDDALTESGVTRSSLVGRRVGSYEVLREIGHGGMGAVYEAVRADDHFRKRVALKTIWRGADSEVIVRRFRQERQILAALAHPNIAGLHDGGVTDDGTPYFAMEFVDGEPIDAYCRSRRLGIRERVELMRQVCAAAQYAHRNLVVHRDLKPGNILVTADGTVKLVDFGIAKLLDPDREGTDTLSRAGLHPFTTAYASPEQLRGDAVSTSTDVYSLGVVLYQLLSGRAPFGVSSSLPGELIALICEVQPVLPSRACTAETVAEGGLPQVDRLRRQLTGELDAIVMMAMRKEPERRYASVEALSEDLRRYLGRLPVSARRDTVRYRVARFVGRNRAAMVFGSLTVAAVVGGTAMALTQARLARAERDRAQAEGDRAARVASFLQGLLGSGDVMWNSPTRIPVRNPTVAQALDSAARRLPTELQREPLIRAALHRTIGKAYSVLARPADAKAQLDSALAIHLRLLGADHPDVGVDLHYLAYATTGVPADSTIALVRHAIDIFERHRPDTIADYAPTIHDLALFISSRGRFAEAESLYQLVLRHEEAQEEPRLPLLALTQGSLGLTYWNQGRFDQGVEMMQRGVATFDSIPTADLGEHGNAMFTLGTALNSLNRGVAALPYLQRARGILVRLFGDSAPIMVQVGVALADSYAAAGDTVRSDQSARAALRLGENLPKGSESVRFQAEWTYARLLRKQKRLEEAERIGRRQYALAAISARDVPFYWADATFMLGAILIDRGKLREAEPYMLDSYATGRDKLGAGHVRTQRVLPGLVMINEGLGRMAEARRYRALMPDTMRRRFDSTRAVPDAARR
jgi:serine/threonine-protein kinase